MSEAELDAIAEAADDPETWVVPVPSRTPLVTAAQTKGSDKSRVLSLHKELADPGHRSWQLLDPANRTPAIDALRILAANHSLPPANRLKTG